jgi:hypothetical protein
MRCKYPVKTRKGDKLQEFPCGQCMPCRITRRQEWTYRILLEMRETPYTYFVTLTYNDENLPSPFVRLSPDLRPLVDKRSGRFKYSGSLDDKAITTFMKRLRARIKYENSIDKIRFFGVGEYGDLEGRPHYHLIIFSPIELIKAGDNIGKAGDTIFHKTWNNSGDPIGHVDINIIPSMDDGIRIARYCASYTVKKLTTDKAIHSSIYKGRPPEFSRMSRRPGIGMDADAIYNLVDSLFDKDLLPEYVDPDAKDVVRIGDFHMARMNGKKWPLARPVKDKLVKLLGGDKREDAQKALQHHLKTEMKMWRRSNKAYEQEEEKKQEESKNLAERFAKINRQAHKVF